MAIAAIVSVCASMIHEGIGHGGMCLASHANPVMISSVEFQCSVDSRLISAGGTLANFFAALLFFAVSHMVTRSAPWRVFLWLSMTVNLLQAGGYFLYSGIGNIGDWSETIRGLSPVWLRRVLLTLIGVASYCFFVLISLKELRPILPMESVARMRHAKKICLTSYFTIGIVACVAGLFNPSGMILVAISAAAASFGGTSGLAWMWQLLRRPRIESSSIQLPQLKRSWGWIAAAGIVTTAFIAFVGPGVRFS